MRKLSCVILSLCCLNATLTDFFPAMLLDRRCINSTTAGAVFSGRPVHQWSMFQVHMFHQSFADVHHRSTAHSAHQTTVVDLQTDVVPHMCFRSHCRAVIFGYQESLSLEVVCRHVPFGKAGRIVSLSTKSVKQPLQNVLAYRLARNLSSNTIPCNRRRPLLHIRIAPRNKHKFSSRSKLFRSHGNAMAPIRSFKVWLVRYSSVVW